ncbi:MAG: flagellar filament capping protein FliD, partial [candidate division Zixibacteria bacterium]|nr:flagellar filament capping protein FliD [candidate division Zixibacteria bacterium]
ARSTTFTQGKFTVSDEDAVEISQAGDLSPGTFDIRVLDLARNHQLASQGIEDPDDTALGTGSFQISVGSGSLQTITVDTTNNTLAGLKDAINNADLDVSASIINDGTTNNSFRLILTAKDTGAKNKITVQSSLTGGVNPNFTTSSFDTPETDGFSALATSAVSLGSSAAYTGAENKTYTFTVAGSGTQTVGTDVITINYTDGTNSGSIVVNAVDTEVALSGTGSDGLTISFGAGDLIAGDTFTVSTFAPELQKPTDARISVGSTDGGGAPIQITSESNNFAEALPGMNLTVKKVTAAGLSITITSEHDINGIEAEINGFISVYNDALLFIDKQFKYNPDTRSSGVLFTEGTLRTMQTALRSSAVGIVQNLAGNLNALATIGIRTDGEGRLRIANKSMLEDAIKNKNKDLQRLFGDDIISSRPEFQLLVAARETIAGTNYEVDITQVATRGYYEGVTIADPATSPLIITSSNNVLKFSIGPTQSEDIILTTGSYTSFAQLVKEIQTRIDADKNIGDKNVTVSFTQSGSTGVIRITSGEYGSNSSVSVILGSNDVLETLLGLKNANPVVGQDVAGTINGEEAKGSGQTLTGKTGNKTTEGLKLRITLDAAGLIEGSEGTISLTKGIASKLRDTLFRITDTVHGSLASRVKGLDSQVQDIKEQIARIDERLALRRKRLLDQFRAMEQALSQINAQGAFLASGLTSLVRI